MRTGLCFDTDFAALVKRHSVCIRFIKSIFQPKIFCMKNIKTTILSLLLAAATGTVMAQDPPQRDTTNFNRTDSMNRFNAGNPDSIKLRANRDSAQLNRDLNQGQAAADSLRATTDSINTGNPTGVTNSGNVDSTNTSSSTDNSNLNQGNTDSSNTNPTGVTNSGNTDSTNNINNNNAPNNNTPDNSNNASSPSSLANPGITDSAGKTNNAPVNVTVSPSATVTDSTGAATAPVTNNNSNMPATTTTQNNLNNVNNNNNNNATAALPRGVNVVDAVALQTGLTRFSALPILNTYVPEAMVTQLKNQYGDKLYDITMLKTGENQYGFAVRTQENGTYKSEMVSDTGVAKPQ
jgi:hypothetical protein